MRFFKLPNNNDREISFNKKSSRMVKEILGFKNNGLVIDKDLNDLVLDFSRHQDTSLFNMKLGGKLGKLKKQNKFI